MKFILVLCLVALISCTLLDALKCFINEPKVQEVGLRVLTLVYNKEFGKILGVLLEYVWDLINAFKACIKYFK